MAEQEQTAYNMNQHKVNIIAKLMMDAEEVMMDLKLKPVDRIAFRYQIYQSISTLIYNRTKEKERNLLEYLKRQYTKNCRIPNPHKNLYLEGSEMWIKTKTIPNIVQMKQRSEKFIQYVGILMKRIGIDIQSKNSSIYDVT